MIVCLCKGVSCRTIQNEVRRGARTIGEIARNCSAGTCCGACVNQIKDLVRAQGGLVHARHDHLPKR